MDSTEPSGNFVDFFFCAGGGVGSVMLAFRLIFVDDGVSTSAGSGVAWPDCTSSLTIGCFSFFFASR